MSPTSAIALTTPIVIPPPASTNSIIARAADALDAAAALLSIHAPGRMEPRIATSYGLFDDETPAELATRADDWVTTRFDRRSTGNKIRLALCDDALVMLFFTSVSHEIMLLTLRRHDDEPEFDARDCERAGAIYGWIADALMLAGYCADLEVRARALEAALDVCDAGLVLLDAQGGILHANRQAEALLAKCGGIRRVDNSLSAARLQDTLRLQMAIRHVASSRDDQYVPLLFIARDGRRPLLAAVVGLGQGAPEHGPAVLLYVLDPDTDMTAAIEPLCRAYGLTAAETRLTRHLVAGLTLAESAARMRIRPQTARAYLKHVFAKTNCARQAELMRIMLTGSARLRSGLEPRVVM